MDGGAWWAAVHGVTKNRTRLSKFTFTFHFHALEKEMATHSSVLAWRIPGTGVPGGLQSIGSHRVGHDWSDLAAAAVCENSHCSTSLPTAGIVYLLISSYVGQCEVVFYFIFISFYLITIWILCCLFEYPPLKSLASNFIVFFLLNCRNSSHILNINCTVIWVTNIVFNSVAFHSITISLWTEPLHFNRVQFFKSLILWLESYCVWLKKIFAHPQ